MLPLGPRLVGETEKTLNALLVRALDGTGLDEPGWVTLVLAADLRQATELAQGPEPAATVVAAIADRTHRPGAAALVATLQAHGLLDAEGRPTADGRATIARVRSRIAAATTGLWDDLPAPDVAATERTLNRVLERGRAALSAG